MAAPSSLAPNPVPQNYNATGAMGGLFAPAYIPGYAPSEAAVQAWQAPRAGGGNLSYADLQSTRMPVPFSQAVGGQGGGQYGPNTAGGTYSFGLGSVDPAALQAMAWNQPYDLNARRDQVAAAMQAQQQAAPAAAPAEQPRLDTNTGGWANSGG